MYIPLRSDSGSGRGLRQQYGLSTLRNLPDSTVAEAAQLESEAREEVAKHNLQGAVSSLYRAVSVDPKFTRAWVILGGLLLVQKQKDAAMEAFHEAMAADPSQRLIPKYLGFGLMAGSQFEDAVPVWRDYMKSYPDDVDGPANLGNCLMKLQR